MSSIQPVLFGLYLLFFIFILTSFIKNVFYNSQGYSRYLRVWNMVIFFMYFIFLCFCISTTFFEKESNTNAFIILPILFTLMSFLIMGYMAHFDFKMSSVRYQWKYRSNNFQTFKTDKPPMSKYEKLLLGIKWILFFIIIFFACALLSLIGAPSNKTESIYIVVASLSITIITVFFMPFTEKRAEILKQNVRYNLLKKIILNEKQRTNTEAYNEACKKALDLYKELFIKSRYYRKNVETNNAIVFDIISRMNFNQSKYDQNKLFEENLYSAINYNKKMTWEEIIKYEREYTNNL